MNQLEKFERVVISSVREGQFDGQQLSYVTTRESSEIASSAQRQQSKKKFLFSRRLPSLGEEMKIIFSSFVRQDAAWKSKKRKKAKSQTNEQSTSSCSLLLYGISLLFNLIGIAM
jgi:hypothetical protein